MNKKRLIEIAAEAGRLVREAEQLLGATAAEAMEAAVLGRLEAAATALRVECRDCDGYGTVEGGDTLMSTCRTCDGRGWVEKPNADVASSPTPAPMFAHRHEDGIPCLCANPPKTTPPTIRSVAAAAPTTVTLCPHGDAVFWNEFNCVVQCHRCGQQFVSMSSLFKVSNA